MLSLGAVLSACISAEHQLERSQAEAARSDALSVLRDTGVPILTEACVVTDPIGPTAYLLQESRHLADATARHAQEQLGSRGIAVTTTHQLRVCGPASRWSARKRAERLLTSGKDNQLVASNGPYLIDAYTDTPRLTVAQLDWLSCGRDPNRHALPNRYFRESACNVPISQSELTTLRDAFGGARYLMTVYSGAKRESLADALSDAFLSSFFVVTAFWDDGTGSKPRFSAHLMDLERGVTIWSTECSGFRHSCPSVKRKVESAEAFQTLFTGSLDQ